jgi:hypothetical protein
MATEDMDRTVSSNPFVYDQLKSLGVSASVWDDVLDECSMSHSEISPAPSVSFWLISMGRLDRGSWTMRGETAFPITISCAVYYGNPSRNSPITPSCQTMTVPTVPRQSKSIGNIAPL